MHFVKIGGGFLNLDKVNEIYVVGKTLRVYIAGDWDKDLEIIPTIFEGEEAARLYDYLLEVSENLDARPLPIKSLD